MLYELFLALTLAIQDPASPAGGVVQQAATPISNPPAASPSNPVPAEGPIVRLPERIEAEAGDLVEVKAESGAELVTWDVSPKSLRIVYPKDDPAQKTVLIHSKAPGRFALVASIPHGKETRVAICWVTIGTPLPVPPGPGPGPGPIPVPVPTVDTVFMVIIEETADAVAARGQMFRDPAIRTLIDSGKLKWRTADKDVTSRDGKPPADLAPYLAKSKGKQLPQLFLVAPDGKLLFEGDMPAPENVAALINKYLKK